MLQTQTDSQTRGSSGPSTSAANGVNGANGSQPNDANGGSVEEEGEEEEEISPARLSLFQTTMGQLMSSNEELFENDTADLTALVEAINERVREGRRGEAFERAEAVKALVSMDGRNMIM